MPHSIVERLNAAGRPVVVDGAMGTELFRRGMALDEAGWSALGASSRDRSCELDTPESST